jgi:thymidylate kinase
MRLTAETDHRMTPSHLRLICLTGIDGSGKTTLALRLSEHLRANGYNVHYVHGIHFVVLLRPIKKLAQMLFMRDTDEYADYIRYRNVKLTASRRHRSLAAVYAAVWFVDYCLQAFRRVTLPIMSGKIVVADRYIYDLLLNIALATGYPFNLLCRLLPFFFIFNPKPDVVFVMDTPEEIALSRKSDVHSIEYLRERRSQYLMLAQRFGFPVLDGRADRDAVLSEVMARCFEAPAPQAVVQP